MRAGLLGPPCRLSANLRSAAGRSGANPNAFVPQGYFSAVDGTKEDFEKMQLDWRDVSTTYFQSIQPNGSSDSNGCALLDLHNRAPLLVLRCLLLSHLRTRRGQAWHVYERYR
eukprot:SAG11_NODE_2408_length_3396_cov_2.260843_6_plen_113_part_00